MDGHQSPAAIAQAQLVIVIGFIVLFFLFKWNGFLYLSLALGLVFILIPSLGKILIQLWFKIGAILGWVNTRLLLGIIFFLFLTPIAFIYRLFNKDAFQLKNTKDSLFLDRNHLYTKQDLINPW